MHGANEVPEDRSQGSWGELLQSATHAGRVGLPEPLSGKSAQVLAGGSLEPESTKDVKPRSIRGH